MAPFRTTYSDDALLPAVHAVTLHADEAAAAHVAPAVFDAARAGAGHPQLPKAKQVCRRLRLGWYEVLALAHEPGARSAAHRVGLAGRGAQHLVGLDEVVVALRIAAARAEVTSIWPARYEAERAAIIAAQRRSHDHGTPTMQALPTVAQIEVQHGWDVACHAAGLADTKSHVRARRAPSQVEITDRFVDDVGCLPWSMLAINNYARARSLAAPKLKSPHHYVAEVTARRSTTGKWTPPGPPPPDERPDETQIHDAPAIGHAPMSRSYRSRTDLAGVIAGVAEAYRRAGARTLHQKLHRRLAAESDGTIPSPAVVDRAAKAHGTSAAAIRAAAQEQARS